MKWERRRKDEMGGKKRGKENKERRGNGKGKEKFGEKETIIFVFCR